MFKKKRSKHILEDEIIVSTSKVDKVRELEDEISVSVSNEEPNVDVIEEIKEVIEEEVVEEIIEEEVIKEEPVEEEIIQDIHIIDDDFEIETEESEELVVGNFKFYDNDPTTECAVDEDDEEDDEIIEEEPIEEVKDKKDIGKYFEKSKKSNKKIKEKPVKKKKKSKREQLKDKDFKNLKNQRVFVFRKKKYSKVEDFIKYLNSNYLDIDKISREVLDNKNFYGWISKRSGVFDDSIKQFKEIKEKIEKK